MKENCYRVLFIPPIPANSSRFSPILLLLYSLFCPTSALSMFGSWTPRHEAEAAKIKEENEKYENIIKKRQKNTTILQKTKKAKPQ